MKRMNKILKVSFEESHTFIFGQHPLAQHLNPLVQFMEPHLNTTPLALTGWELESRLKSKVSAKPGTQAPGILASGPLNFRV